MSPDALAHRQFAKGAAGLILVGIAGCTASGGSAATVEAWEDLDEFALKGRVEGWTGIEPAIIEGEDNPTPITIPWTESCLTTN